MKTLSLISLFIFLTNCTAHSVRLGTKCTTAATDGSFEKSFVWIVDKKTANNFDKKINKENCGKNS